MTASTATAPATSRADVSLTGFGNESRVAHLAITVLRVTIRKSSYRSLASLERDLARCRACVEAGYPLESLPVRAPGAGQRAYMYGQAPGIVEGEERLPWRGRAGRTLRRWLELDEEAFYATFYCASVTRCYPGRAASRPRRPHADAARAGALPVLARLGARAAAAAADRRRSAGSRSAACSGSPQLTAAIGERFERDGVPGRAAPASVRCEQLAERAGEPRAARCRARTRPGGARAPLRPPLP